MYVLGILFSRAWTPAQLLTVVKGGYTCVDNVCITAGRKLNIDG